MRNYRDFRQVGITSCGFMPFIGIVEAPKDTSILNHVFQDSDGNPRNDLGVFESEETSPEVRRYVEQLHRPLPEGEALPEKMRDDDAIIQSIPNHGETLTEFENRVDSMLEQEKNDRKVKRGEKKLKDALNNLGIHT